MSNKVLQHSEFYCEVNLLSHFYLFILLKVGIAVNQNFKLIFAVALGPLLLRKHYNLSCVKSVSMDFHVLPPCGCVVC